MSSSEIVKPSHLGVTQPISLDGPKPLDLQMSKLLIEELKAQNTFPSADESRSRERVLALVQSLVKRFVYEVCHDKLHLSEAISSSAGGKIFTFGSYRLGVHGPGADIDTLCVVPKHITREDFFGQFQQMLLDTPEVTSLTSVPDAFVPVMKAVISGIDIDFLFARLAMASVPDDLELSDPAILKNLDESCVRSLNGSRVTDDILRLVPNVQVFRDALRCIKLWAQRRAIYSNVLGYLGGVAWAMLVARICQLYPNACAATTVAKFFTIMQQWQWPQPVILKTIESGPLRTQVWNPKRHKGDADHIMPIITPAYPSMCSTHNVSTSNLKLITSELSRGATVVNDIFHGQSLWSDLVKKHTFFNNYRYYLQIWSSANESELQKRWSGAVETKIRQLVMRICEGRRVNDMLTAAYPYTKSFPHIYHCLTEEERTAVTSGIISQTVFERKEDEVLDSDGALLPGACTIHTTTWYIGLDINNLYKPPAGVPKKLDISLPSDLWLKRLRSWAEAGADVDMVVMKSSNLPDEVFGPGEREVGFSARSKSTKRKSAPDNSQDTDSKKSKPLDASATTLNPAATAALLATQTTHTLAGAADLDGPPAHIFASGPPEELLIE